jgi:hypothetical protein
MSKLHSLNNTHLPSLINSTNSFVEHHKNASVIGGVMFQDIQMGGEICEPNVVRDIWLERHYTIVLNCCGVECGCVKVDSKANEISDYIMAKKLSDYIENNGPDGASAPSEFIKWLSKIKRHCRMGNLTK